MLTARGWWLLTFVLLNLAMGAVLALRGPTTLLMIGLALFLWFVWEWTVFAIQARVGLRNLEIRRELQDERGRVSTFWAGRSFRVGLRARLDGISDHVSLVNNRAPDPGHFAEVVTGLQGR